jgi:DNA-binding NarL/FixJ family response regulator
MTLQESNNRIIDLLAAGKTVKEIAEVLSMSKRTVEDRIYELRKKEKCTTVTQLVMKLLNPVFGRMDPAP